MAKFKKGDRVKALSGTPDGHVGTIMYVNKGGMCAVEFDTWADGHDCSSGRGPHCKSPHGFWMNVKWLELLEEEPELNFKEKEFQEVPYGGIFKHCREYYIKIGPENALALRDTWPALFPVEKKVKHVTNVDPLFTLNELLQRLDTEV